jgi:hypothetical protein
MSLRNRCARPNDLPALATGVASSTDVIQPAERLRQVFALWQGTLPGRFARAINVKDHPGASCSIHEPSRLLVVGKWTALEIIEKECAQRFNWCFCQRR